MNFGQAIDAMKEGTLVQRAGWNGKGMYLFLVTDWDVNASPSFCAVVKEAGHCEFAPFIAMRTAQDTVIPWLASQADMLAYDWQSANLEN